MSDTTLDLPDDIFERVDYPEEVIMMYGGPKEENGEYGLKWKTDCCPDFVVTYIEKYAF